MSRSITSPGRRRQNQVILKFLLEASSGSMLKLPIYRGNFQNYEKGKRQNYKKLRLEKLKKGTCKNFREKSNVRQKYRLFYQDSTLAVDPIHE